jgi:hypothetical protein
VFHAFPPVMLSFPSNHCDAALEKGLSSSETGDVSINVMSKGHLDQDSGHDTLDEALSVYKAESSTTEVEVKQIKNINLNVVDWDGDDDPAYVIQLFHSSARFITPQSVSLMYIPETH